MLIASFVIELTKGDTSKHFRYPFRLADRAARLEIAYSYSPKYCFDARIVPLVKAAYQKSGEKPPADEKILKEGLSNLITLSVDSPSGLAGNAHRHLSNARYFISAEKSSDGFSAVPIKEGEWAIVLSTHSVISERVEVRIEVSVYD